MTGKLLVKLTFYSERTIVYEIEKSDVVGSTLDERNMRRDQSHIYVQSALLYSTSEGERRIRVHNLAIPLTNMKHMPFEYVDINAITLFFARMALNRMSTNLNLQVVRGVLEMHISNLCRALHKS